jgi:hypothetical protein
MSYLEELNKKVKKYQYLLNFTGILIALIGIYFTMIQQMVNFSEIKRETYKYNGEQFPTIDFELLDKDLWVLHVNKILQTEMLFQFANIYYHPDIEKYVSREPIRIHDKNLYLTPLLAYINFGINTDSLLKSDNLNSYAICRTPVVLEINYIKYGESRIVRAIYDIEFVIQKNHNSEYTKKHINELKGAYLLRFIDVKSKYETELREFKRIKIIGGA